MLNKDKVNDFYRKICSLIQIEFYWGKEFSPKISPRSPDALIIQHPVLAHLSHHDLMRCIYYDLILISEYEWVGTA